MTDAERERIAAAIEANTRLLMRVLPSSAMVELEGEAFLNLADLVRVGYYASDRTVAPKGGGEPAPLYVTLADGTGLYWPAVVLTPLADEDPAP